MSGLSAAARRCRAALTVKNVLATLAFGAALTGTSIAASAASHAKAKVPVYTGAAIKDSSLTGKDVHDRTIEASTFSNSAQAFLKRIKGAPGAAGPTGATGKAGDQGLQGDRGPDAARAYSYIKAEDTSSFITDKDHGSLNPSDTNGSECGHGGTPTCGAPKLAYTGNGSFASVSSPGDGSFPTWNYCVSPYTSYCHEGNQIGGNGQGATLVNRVSTPMLGFIGDENGSYLTLMGPGNVIVTASMDFLHQLGDYHSRVSCQPEARLSDGTNTNTNPFTPMGTPTVMSAYQSQKIAHMTVTGALHFDTPGDFDFQVTCHTLDDFFGSGNDGDWIFIQGNATALSTEK